MLVTPTCPSYYNRIAEFTEKPSVKLAAAVAFIFATSFVPIHYFPTFSKLGQFAILASSSLGMGVFFTYRYQ